MAETFGKFNRVFLVGLFISFLRLYEMCTLLFEMNSECFFIDESGMKVESIPKEERQDCDFYNV